MGFNFVIYQVVSQFDQITMNSMDEWIGDESKQDYKINHNKLYSKNSLSFSSKADRKTKSVCSVQNDWKRLFPQEGQAV